MTLFFKTKTLIEQGFAPVYIDKILDILLHSNSKGTMFQFIEQLHLVSAKHTLKLAPEKLFLSLLTVNTFGHEIGFNTTEPTHSKVAAIHELPSPTFICVLNFLPKSLKNY